MRRPYISSNLRVGLTLTTTYFAVLLTVCTDTSFFPTIAIIIGSAVYLNLILLLIFRIHK